MTWYRIDYRDTDGETSSWFIEARSAYEAKKKFAAMYEAKILHCVHTPDYLPSLPEANR